MSVAFRRDSDEEHLEPRFELPIPPGPNLVTPRGLALIEAEAAEWEQRYAAETDVERRKQVLRDLRYWRNRQSTAQLAPVPDATVAAIGTFVTFKGSGGERTIAIVGHDESDPAAGRIAFAAPLARALIGAEVGEEVELPPPLGAVTVTAIAVQSD